MNPNKLLIIMICFLTVILSVFLLLIFFSNKENSYQNESENLPPILKMEPDISKEEAETIIKKKYSNSTIELKRDEDEYYIYYVETSDSKYGCSIHKKLKDLRCNEIKSSMAGVEN